MLFAVEGCQLRPVEQEDLPRLLRLLDDPDTPGEYQWFGFRTERVRQLERRWHEDGLLGGDQCYLAVVANGELAGWVTWFPVPRSAATEIGIALFEPHRGHGVGSEAQRKLAAYLFEMMPLHRIQAGTEIDNIAEQRALEKAGFRREGVLRGWTFRAGHWRDSVIYAITRDDL